MYLYEKLFNGFCHKMTISIAVMCSVQDTVKSQEQIYTRFLHNLHKI